MLYHEIIAGHPAEKVALIFRDKKTTYGELRERVASWGAFLQQQGIGQGDTVGLLSKNADNYVAAYLAVVSIGAVIVPLNFQLAAPEVAFIVKDSHMKALITRDPLDLKQALAEKDVDWELKQFVYDDLLAAPQGTPVIPPMDEHDNCTIIYTSGTTGTPKGAMLCHRGMIVNAEAYIKIVGVFPEDVALMVLPMYHAFGWTFTVTGNLLKGATIVIQENYVFKDAMNLIKNYQVTTFGGVPTMMLMFVNGATPEELKNLRYFVCGGAPCPGTLLKAFREKFGRPIQEGYGLSEASPIVAVNPASKIKASSIGLPLPDITTQIQDEAGVELPPHKVGELCVRGENVMLGYYHKPEETAYALRGGWLHTGDLAYKDEEGYIFIVDRLKDLIISSGENIYPREIEEELYRHPDIAEAAVIGLPDKLRGQIACAYVVMKPGKEQLDKRTLRKYLLERIAPYKVPKEYVFCEGLPKNPTGKIMKRVLRDKAVTEMVSKKKR